MINGGIDIKIKELSDMYELQSFILREKVGGDIAEGEFEVTTTTDNKTTDFYELNINISDESGYQLDIEAYAYNIEYHHMYMTVKFICAKPEFIKDNLVKSYTSILSAINSNWIGNFDYKPGSDIECDIHQRSETGYQLVSKLIKGLRYKSAYGFRSNELFVRDLGDAPDLDMGEQGFSIQIGGLNISKSKVKDLEPRTEEIGLYTSHTYSKKFRQVRTEYIELVKNYSMNTSLYKILGSYLIPVKFTRFDPQLKIGNIIKYSLKNLSYDKFLIYSKVMSWRRGQGISTDLELMGYDW